MVKYLFVRSVLHISLRMNYYKNISYIVQIMKQFLLKCLTNTMLHFKNYYKQLPIPFVVYAGFECFTKPMNTCSPNPKESYNYNYQKS